jgi:hypothetical protein
MEFRQWKLNRDALYETERPGIRQDFKRVCNCKGKTGFPI